MKLQTLFNRKPLSPKAKARRKRIVHKYVYKISRVAIPVLLILVYTLIITSCQKRADKAEYELKFESWKAEYTSMLELARAWEDETRNQQLQFELEQDPYEQQLNEEARALAKVLYGVKDNNTDDLRTYCWCVFNRVDNKSYPNNLTAVIGQSNQWMRYAYDNPVLDELYQIAREELNKWHTGNTRPVSDEYVYMSWSSNSIVLRNTYKDGPDTKHWTYR